MDELTSMLKEIYQSMPEYVGELKSHFMEAADLWRLGKDTEALRAYLLTLEAYDTFLQLLDLFMEKGGVAQDEATAQVRTTLIEATNKLREAMEEEDYTMVPDVLEYELVPALESILELKFNPALEEE